MGQGIFQLVRQRRVAQQDRDQRAHTFHDGGGFAHGRTVGAAAWLGRARRGGRWRSSGPAGPACIPGPGRDRRCARRRPPAGPGRRRAVRAWWCRRPRAADRTAPRSAGGRSRPSLACAPRPGCGSACRGSSPAGRVAMRDRAVRRQARQGPNRPARAAARAPAASPSKHRMGAGEICQRQVQLLLGQGRPERGRPRRRSRPGAGRSRPFSLRRR